MPKAVRLSLTLGTRASQFMEKQLYSDVQNIYYTKKQSYDCNFDYNKFWAKATSNRKVIKAIAYAIDRNDEKKAILRAIGFEVKLNPFIQRVDGSAKGDWDFDLLVGEIRKDLNVTVEVYGVPKFTSNSLISSASKYIPIGKDLLLDASK